MEALHEICVLECRQWHRSAGKPPSNHAVAAMQSPVYTRRLNVFKCSYILMIGCPLRAAITQALPRWIVTDLENDT